MTSPAQHTMIRCLTAWLAALAVMLAPLALPRALAQPQDAAVAQARQHYQQGKSLFGAGDYQGAISAFETANRLAPSPILHFNIGLAYERLGNKEEALQRYRRYLEEMPQASNRSAVEARIRQLEAALRPAAREPAPQPGPVLGATGTAIQGSEPQPTGGADATAAPPAPPAQQQQLPAGDPLLERVAAIDVAMIRDQRAEPMSRAAGVESTGAGATDAGDGEKESKPPYKQVWFWAVVGVSALILVDIATSGRESDTPTFSSGPALLRF